METLDRFRGVVSRKFRTDGNQFIEIETNSLEFLLFLFFLSFFFDVAFAYEEDR